MVRAKTAKPSNTISFVLKYKKKFTEKEASKLSQLSKKLEMCIMNRKTTAKPSTTLSAVSKSKQKFITEKEPSTLPELSIPSDMCIMNRKTTNFQRSISKNPLMFINLRDLHLNVYSTLF